jgi:hypothetical protein
MPRLNLSEEELAMVHERRQRQRRLSAFEKLIVDWLVEFVSDGNGRTAYVQEGAIDVLRTRLDEFL